jgi:hypothetical protein
VLGSRGEEPKPEAEFERFSSFHMFFGALHVLFAFLEKNFFAKVKVTKTRQERKRKICHVGDFLVILEVS